MFISHDGRGLIDLRGCPEMPFSPFPTILAPWQEIWKTLVFRVRPLGEIPRLACQHPICQFRDSLLANPSDIPNALFLGTLSVH